MTTYVCAYLLDPLSRNGPWTLEELLLSFISFLILPGYLLPMFFFVITAEKIVRLNREIRATWVDFNQQ